MRKLRCKYSRLTKIGSFVPFRKSQLRFQPATCRLDRRSGLARFNPSGKGGRLIGLSIARKQNRSRPKVALIRHLALRQLQYDEIVTQFAAAVFAAFHVRFEIVSEQCDVQRQGPRLHGVRSESGANLPVVAYTHTQHANFGRRDRHRIAAKPAAPFLAVDDKTRSVNRVAAPSRGITLLSRCEFWFGEAITPAEMVPIINVEGDGNRLFPEV